MTFCLERNSSTGTTVAIGTAVALMLSASSAAMATTIPVSIAVPIVHESVRTSSALSRCSHLPGERQSWEETRAARIKALRGKYRNALTPSEEFALVKNLELEME